ncbi:hypothetical protein, partial [uncultured Halopseudomonas sp.]|uniref:hypothetical protein n=1 Tax=uncultured Halopseudomonas sp. TaxID=2901193 RepID=UPI0030EB1CB5
MTPTPLFQRQNLAIAVAFALLPISASAKNQNAFRLPTMEVVGSEQTAVSRQTGAVVIVDREQIERIQPKS